MSRTTRLLPLVLTAASLVTLPQESADASYQEIALDGLSVQAETKPFAMVDITWPEGTPPVTAKVRVQRGGQWTEWETLHAENDHGPDPSVPEGIQRAGTDPLWVGDATDVEASAVTGGGTAVSNAKVVLIQPGVLATDSEGLTDAVEPGASRAPAMLGTTARVVAWKLAANYRSPTATIAGSARLGLPITDHYQVQGGVRQKFQRGRLTYDEHSHQVHVQHGRAS
jgi:hypothetical protein